jgi:hypothetical protein
MNGGVTFHGLLVKIAQHRLNMKLPVIKEGFNTISDEIQDAICGRLSPEDQRRLCSDAPPEPWPAYLLPFRLLAQEKDRGLGDIIARTIGPAGGDAFKDWYREKFGQDCGCRDRQVFLNNRYPLP